MAEQKSGEIKSPFKDAVMPKTGPTPSTSKPVDGAEGYPKRTPGPGVPEVTYDHNK